MKINFYILWILIMISLTTFALGCGHKQEDSDKEKSEMGHGKQESPSGASFKLGEGVTLTDETSKILGVEIVDVGEELLPQEVHFKVQIFDETHHFSELNVHHTGCLFHGSGFLPSDQSDLVKPKQSVKLKTSQGEILDGFVVAVQEPLTQGELEIVVGVTTANRDLKDGEFVNAVISVPRHEPVTVIPSSALLRTIQGTYVYAVNGDAYYRTAVTAGGEVDGKTEIKDGLYGGDQVVTKPVETLWLIELRATKGGGHCH